MPPAWHESNENAPLLKPLRPPRHLRVTNDMAPDEHLLSRETKNNPASHNTNEGFPVCAADATANTDGCNISPEAGSLFCSQETFMFSSRLLGSYQTCLAFLKDRSPFALSHIRSIRPLINGDLANDSGPIIHKQSWSKLCSVLRSTMNLDHLGPKLNALPLQSLNAD
ncbi:hypothetical protein K432DRAFT_97105 [Lepidopterella palustris CBS 459.81]|uniref:Uncharacterized protein n=1 Tax=Lepidopterella palustris CBS 459.81 TaxID=1314670 RepID=A0A8E2E6V9_9PEZI|nr:hypothetical protein K432DRAFT_97105 [Lepidopterella palustris CBS 459.81]